MGTSYTVSNTDLNLEYYTDEFMDSTPNFDVFGVFGHLFSTEEDLVEKNKWLILTLNRLREGKNYEIIRSILVDQALKDLHPSLIKSAIIMSETIEGIGDALDIAISAYNYRKRQYQN